MPYRARRICLRCPALTTEGSSYCALHQRAPWRRPDAPPPPRIRGRKLQALRARLFAREPFCRVCAAEGVVTVATIRDHIIPLAEGGIDTDENCQPLCHTHSDEKTRRESQRGVARSW